MSDATQVVVVGGGYAGVTAANRLTKRDDVAVTLVNARPTFVERIRLHQRVAGSHDAVVDYREVLADAVRLEVATVERIDAATRRLELAGGGSLGYDYLVYAVGSTSAAPAVPGAAEHAYPLASLEEADRLAPELAAAGREARITVVGAGPSGIETASELAEQGRAVTLVCGDVLGPYLHPKGRSAVAAALGRLGVAVLAGPGTMVTAVTGDAVQLADGRDVPSDVTIWTAGFAVPDLAARSGLSTDAAGRLRTDETLTSVDDDRIVAAGDAGAPSDLPFRMSCQAAGQLGGAAADTVLARLVGTEPAPVAVGFLGQCLSLGRGAGLFQFARRGDVPVRVFLGGRLGGRPGAWLKELVCRSTVQGLTWEARRPGIMRYPSFVGDPRRREVLRARRAAAPSDVVPVA
ncbi:NAD(P)/FAD-dependent oxidoreductase [Krasilnikoviella flava]|uniref:NADH dehydrogenase, FAD-containing subunit n=1 Tax=Krasilnikoviella flava TaxID=526729 RepID=A0A1T5LZN8_9MICO|nr:FAD-dependent oxidoreductase [Krasilnikoviella flava]SKC81345.1 NADH dehydrogenase, FAD-containing subunit [Krasilnikoviella flava]